MPQTASITMRMDADDKRRAEILFSSLGLNMTSAFNIFIKQALMCQGLPFSVELHGSSDDYFYSKANCAHLDRSIAQIKDAKPHELAEGFDDE